MFTLDEMGNKVYKVICPGCGESAVIKHLPYYNKHDTTDDPNYGNWEYSCPKCACGCGGYSISFSTLQEALTWFKKEVEKATPTLF